MTTSPRSTKKKYWWSREEQRAKTSSGRHSHCHNNQWKWCESECRWVGTDCHCGSRHKAGDCYLSCAISFIYHARIIIFQILFLHRQGNKVRRFNCAFLHQSWPIQWVFTVTLQSLKNSRNVWLNQILMPSINNSHPTLKSWCLATFLFLALILFVLHTALSTSRRFCKLSMRKTSPKSQIYLLQLSRQFRMLSTRKTFHSNQIYLLQSMPSASRQIRMLSIRKTLFRMQIFLLRSHLHFKSLFDRQSAFSGWQLLRFHRRF